MAWEIRTSCFTHTLSFMLPVQGWHLGLGSPLSHPPISFLICYKAGLMALGLGWEAGAGAPEFSPSLCRPFASDRGQAAGLLLANRRQALCPGPTPSPARQWSPGRRMPSHPDAAFVIMLTQRILHHQNAWRVWNFG